MTTAALLLAALIATAAQPSSSPESRTARVSKHDELATHLDGNLERIADGVDGSVAYLAVDLTTGARTARRAEEPFPAASAIKIGVLYELFAQADEGRVALDDPKPLPEASRAGGAGILQHLKSPVLSLRDHAMLMILLSDNSSTNVLIDTLGLAPIDSRMRQLGATTFRLRRRMMDTAAADLVVVMDALLTGRGLTPGSRAAAHAMLKEPGPTSMRAGIPAGVPVAAKRGDLDGVRTEVAWVDLKGRPYLLCVMASFLADDAAGDTAITDISRAAFSYFSRLSRAGVEGRLLSPR